MEEGWRTSRDAFKQSRNKVFRYGCYFAIFELLTFAGGIGVWMIFHGLWWAGLRLFLYWKPAHAWVTNLLKIQDKRYLQMPEITWYRMINLLINLAIACAFIFLGVAILANGFLNQNLIYILFFNSK